MGASMTAQRPPDLDEVWAGVGSELERFVRGRVSDSYAAEDIVAEVLARIHQHLPALNDQERVTAWVFRIARNAIIDYYRRTGRRGEAFDVNIDPAGDEGADVWIDDQAAVLTELASCIRPLVDALPPDYRRWSSSLTDLEGRHAGRGRKTGRRVGLRHEVAWCNAACCMFAALVLDCCEVTTDTTGQLVDFQ